MFRRFVSRFGWIIFLLLAGVYLLLNNMGVVGPWGSFIWGGLFAVVGLGFLVWYFADRARWWRLVPGFTLLAAGVVIMLQSVNVELGNWAGAIVLFGVALSFWALLLRGADFWWAVIPAGVLTVTSLLVGLRAQLSGEVWTAALLIGLALVFFLVYLVRFGQQDTRWAIVPAGWLMLFGLVTLVTALDMPIFLKKWWPILLILAALALLVITILRRPAPAPAPVKQPAQNDTPLAPAPIRSAPVPEIPPSVPEPAPKTPAKPASEPDIDIYKLIEQQPKEPPPSSGGDAKAGK